MKTLKQLALENGVSLKDLRRDDWLKICPDMSVENTLDRWLKGHPSHKAVDFRRYYCFLDHQCQTEIRCLKDGQVRSIHVEDKEGFVNTCLLMDAENWNVYAGINERIAGGTRGKDVLRTSAFFLDIDAKLSKGEVATYEDIEEVKFVVDDIINEYRPNLGVFTGNGYHLYWRFREDINNIETSKEIESKLRGAESFLREKYQSEKVRFDSVHDLSRIARIPGTVNKKNMRVCEIIHQDDDSRISVDELMLPSPVKRVEAGSLSKTVSGWGLRHCFKEIVERGRYIKGGGHILRTYLTVDMINIGWSDGQIHDFMKNQCDYDENNTSYHIEQLRKNNLKSVSCKKLCQTPFIKEFYKGECPKTRSVAMNNIQNSREILSDELKFLEDIQFQINELRNIIWFKQSAITDPEIMLDSENMLDPEVMLDPEAIR